MSIKSFKPSLKVKVLLLSLSLLLIFSIVSPLLLQAASPTNVRLNLPNGGEYVYSHMDSDYIKGMSGPQIAALGNATIKKVIFMSPATVKAQYDALSLSVGIERSKEFIALGVEFAIAYGIKQAKVKLVEHLGTSIANKLIPYLSAFSWGYLAVDLLSVVGSGQELVRLNLAATSNKGLIYEWKGLGYSTFSWYYWDSTSPYGAYPYVTLNPTPWQYGNVTVY